jgi:hypothetical protein
MTTTTPLERSGATRSPPTVIVAATANVWRKRPEQIRFSNYTHPEYDIALVVRGRAGDQPAPWFDRLALVPTVALRCLPPLVVGHRASMTAVAVLERDPFDDPWFRAAAYVPPHYELPTQENGDVWVVLHNPFLGERFVSGVFSQGVARGLRETATEIERAAVSPPAQEGVVQ